MTEVATRCETLRDCSFCEFSYICRYDQAEHRDWLLGQRLGVTRRRVLVMSNKGGVGKSTITVNLAAALAARGMRVGVVDADLAGPSVPHLMGLEETPAEVGPIGLVPPVAAGVKVFSLGFVENGSDPLASAPDVREEQLARMIAGVGWGTLDLLLVDMPSGTGDELNVLTTIDRELFGCIMVTTPHTLSHANARRAVRTLAEMELPLLGVIENMSGMHSDHVATTASPYAAAMFAASIDTPLLGQIPFDANAAEAAEAGEPVVSMAPGSPAARALMRTADALSARLAF